MGKRGTRGGRKKQENEEIENIEFDRENQEIQEENYSENNAEPEAKKRKTRRAKKGLVFQEHLAPQNDYLDGQGPLFGFLEQEVKEYFKNAERMLEEAQEAGVDGDQGEFGELILFIKLHWV